MVTVCTPPSHASGRAANQSSTTLGAATSHDVEQTAGDSSKNHEAPGLRGGWSTLYRPGPSRTHSPLHREYPDWDRSAFPHEHEMGRLLGYPACCT